MNVAELQRLYDEAATYPAKQEVISNVLPDLIENGMAYNRKLSVDQMDERI